MTDPGRTVIVAELAHSPPQGNIAPECFHDDRRFAIRPMAGKRSSAVVTLPSPAPRLPGTSAGTPRRLPLVEATGRSWGAGPALAPVWCRHPAGQR